MSDVVRAGFAVAGFCLLVPAGAFAGGFWTDLFGAGVAGILLVREYTATRPGADARAG